MSYDLDLKAWVGCPACYASIGLIDGGWHDAYGVTELTPADVHRSMPVPDGHDDVWVFDVDGFAGLFTGDCSPADAQAAAEALADVTDSELEALAEFAKNYGYKTVDSAVVDEFRDAYAGEHDSEAEFAESLADDHGMLGSSEIVWPFTCIDWQWAARELFIGGDYWSADTGNGTIHVFRSI